MAKSFSVQVGDFVELTTGEVCDVEAVTSTGCLDNGQALTVRTPSGKILNVSEVWVKILCPVKK